MSKNPTSRRLTSRKRFSDMVTPELVSDLYWNRGMSLADIGAMYGMSDMPVLRFCRKYGILDKGKKLPASSRVLIDKHLSQRQRELVFGTLLGDGCVRRFHKTSQFPKLVLCHGIKQWDYIAWKVHELRPFVSTGPKSYRADSVAAYTFAHPEFNWFREAFYCDNVKRVPRDLSLLTPFAIAVWFCDDGCNKRHRSGSTEAFFATYSFTSEGCSCLVKFLEDSYQLGCYAAQYKHANGVYPELRLTSRGVLRLHELIDSYIPDAMEYKRLSMTGSSETNTRSSSDMEDEERVQTVPRGAEASQ